MLPDQYFDRTKKSLEHTFFGNGLVAHVSMADPICPTLAAVLADKGQLTPLGDDLRQWVIDNYAAGQSWVDLGTSLQWRLFRAAVHTLLRRGNRVFVLVGPFNEHLLEADSLEMLEDLEFYSLLDAVDVEAEGNVG